MKIIQSKNLYLRRFEESDIPKIIEWNNSKPINYDFGLWRYAFANKSTISWIRKANVLGTDGEYTFAVCLKSTNALIGIFGVDIRNYENKVGESYGYIGDESIRNKGYGTEAAKLVLDYSFKKLKLNSIFANIIVTNLPSIRQHEKAGYQKVGVFHDHLLDNNGKFVDSVLYEMTRNIWKNTITK